MERKKAQIKIQEMAFVLVAVVVLFGLVFLFFARFQYSQLQESATETREARTVAMLRTVASMPELGCSSQTDSTTGFGCIDKDKLIAFHEQPGIRNKYTRIWQSSFISKVSVKEVYPEGQEYIIYNKPQSTESTKTFTTYASLCEETIKRSSKCTIAKIKITTIVP